MIRALVLFVCLAAPAGAETVRVFAAASLKGPLDRAVEAWAEATGHEAQVAYGGSATIARQIDQGAPADLVLLASPLWADWLAERGFAGAEAPVAYLSNRLVLIAPEPGALDLTAEAVEARLGDGRLAMGMSKVVPAGIYGRASLEALGLWDGVAERLAEMDNVRAALALVALGEAPLGLVYRTDAEADGDVFVVADLPEESHPAILYPLALLSEAKPARALYDYLQRPEGRAAFLAAGFLEP
ncbi:molybdate ABC transporter substrate-binding protein [Aestuariibius insulae]|uniref:molybdate ABC transporter substrate-binding protein n=1 Tax=Aestuariibius insulae TaxID=2058287 RepID=UPI00345E8C6E